MNDKSLSELIAESFNKAKLETLKFTVMAEICPVSAWMADSNGKILYVNPAYTKLTGFTLEDLQKDNGQAHPPEEREEIINSWVKYATDPLNETYQWRKYGRIARKDGYPIRCLMVAQKVKNDGFVGYSFPATISPDLLSFDSHLEEFFKLSPDLMIIEDSRGYFVKCSRAWTDDFGYSVEELYNQPWSNFFHPEDINKSIKAANSLHQNNLIRFRNRLFNKKTQKYHIISWNASKYQNNFTYGIGRDITDL